VTDDHAVVFVEIPSGSRNKYEYDPELGGIVLDRRLFTAMTYPADYGYVEDARRGRRSARHARACRRPDVPGLPDPRASSVCST
jgi:hypothetical protein